MNHRLQAAVGSHPRTFLVAWAAFLIAGLSVLVWMDETHKQQALTFRGDYWSLPIDMGADYDPNAEWRKAIAKAKRGYNLPAHQIAKRNAPTRGDRTCGNYMELMAQDFDVGGPGGAIIMAHALVGDRTPICVTAR